MELFPNWKLVVNKQKLALIISSKTECPEGKPKISFFSKELCKLIYLVSTEEIVESKVHSEHRNVVNVALPMNVSTMQSLVPVSTLMQNGMMNQIILHTTKSDQDLHSITKIEIISVISLLICSQGVMLVNKQFRQQTTSGELPAMIQKYQYPHVKTKTCLYIDNEDKLTI